MPQPTHNRPPPPVTYVPTSTLIQARTYSIGLFFLLFENIHDIKTALCYTALMNTVRWHWYFDSSRFV